MTSGEWRNEKAMLKSKWRMEIAENFTVVRMENEDSRECHFSENRK